MATGRKKSTEAVVAPKMGRPVNSRSRLQNLFLEDLLKDWKENGLEAMRLLREKSPVDYVKMVAGLIPKESHKVKEQSSAISEFFAILKRVQEVTPVVVPRVNEITMKGGPSEFFADPDKPEDSSVDS